MDVQCEKCRTVYEFDDANVTPNGVSVKCTQCGNLFVVRPRTLMSPAAAARSPLSVSGPSPVPPSARPRSMTPVWGANAADERVWLVRTAATREVRRFRELQTLQQWIVERRVSRDDEISRTGESWKRLGAIAELASFFHAVEEAPEEPPEAPIALPPPPPVTSPPAFATTEPFPISVVGVTPIGSTQSSSEETDVDRVMDGSEMLESPRRGPMGLWVAGGVLLVMASVGGYFWGMRQTRPGEELKRREALQRGLSELEQDSDESLRRAEQELLRALGAEEPSPVLLAALAEVNALWAGSIHEESGQAQAPAADAGAPTSGATEALRRVAEQHLQEAHRYADEALRRAPKEGDADAERAMATVLLVEGAPAAEVEKPLVRSEERRTEDAAVTFVRGALLFREGQWAAARQKLERANTLHQNKEHRDLVRATLLLARIAVREGRRDEAGVLVQKVLAQSGKHARALALAAQLQAPPAPPDAGAMPVSSGAAKREKSDRERLDEDSPTPNGVEGLVRQGNRLLENSGRPKDAKRLFEKALELAPDNIEALNGLGYCNLDSEHFAAAVDIFKRTLSYSPHNGDAILGIAESYKMRGDHVRALEYYRQYKAHLPNGSKISTVEANLRELEVAVPPARVLPHLPQEAK